MNYYRLTFLSHEEGGRRLLPSSKQEYRHITKIDGRYWSVRIQFKTGWTENQIVARAQLLMAKGPQLPDYLEVYEGAKLVASGERIHLARGEGFSV